MQSLMQPGTSDKSSSASVKASRRGSLSQLSKAEKICSMKIALIHRNHPKFCSEYNKVNYF